MPSAGRFGVLGPVAAWDGDGERIALKGPRHRAVLARLIVARGRVVPVARLVDDLWVDPRAGAVGAVRTFVGALRRALEPDRPPRAPARLLVTEGPGYALRAEPDAVDAWRFEQAVTAAATLPAEDALDRLTRRWAGGAGPAYAELRRRAAGPAPSGRASPSCGCTRSSGGPRRAWRWAWPPRRCRIWTRTSPSTPGARTPGGCSPSRSIAPAVRATRSRCCAARGRCWSSSSASTRARRCARLETDILDQAAPRPRRAPPGRCGREAPPPTTDGRGRRAGAAGVDGRAAARPRGDRRRRPGGGAPARAAAVAAAEELGDPELTARVIGAYDVPAIWTRSDDPEQAARRSSRRPSARCRARRPDARRRAGPAAGHDRRSSRAARATARPRGAPARPSAIARRLDDPALLAFALNGVFMQTLRTATGLAPRARRDRRRTDRRCPPGTAWSPSRCSGT